MFPSKRSERGFTAIELAIVVTLIVVVSSFGVPRLRDSMERARVRDAFSYLAEVGAAQNAFHDAHGVYAFSLEELGLEARAPEGFEVGEIHPGGSGDLIRSWRISARRKGAPLAYGSYTIAFNERGYSPAACSLAEHATIDPFAQR